MHQRRPQHDAPTPGAAVEQAAQPAATTVKSNGTALGDDLEDNAAMSPSSSKTMAASPQPALSPTIPSHLLSQLSEELKVKMTKSNLTILLQQAVLLADGRAKAAVQKPELLYNQLDLSTLIHKTLEIETVEG